MTRRVLFREVRYGERPHRRRWCDADFALRSALRSRRFAPAGESVPAMRRHPRGVGRSGGAPACLWDQARAMDVPEAERWAECVMLDRLGPRAFRNSCARGELAPAARVLASGSVGRSRGLRDRDGLPCPLASGAAALARGLLRSGPASS